MANRIRGATIIGCRGEY